MLRALNQIVVFLIAFLLISSCTNRRYGHLTNRVSFKKIRQVQTLPKATSRQLSANSEIAPKGISFSADPSSSVVNQLEEIAYFEIPVPNYTLQQLPQNLNTKDASSLKKRNSIHNKLKHRIQKSRSTSKPNGTFGLGKFLGTLIVLFLLFAFLSWLGTLFGIPFWTSMKFLALLALFILILDLLGISEIWMGN